MTLAEKILERLKRGILGSTWADNNPSVEDLFADYGADLLGSIQDVLDEEKSHQPASFNQKNTSYLFGIKGDCQDWPTGVGVMIVHRDFWKKNHCIDDGHLGKKINLPRGFGEESESLFSCKVGVEEGTKLLLAAGFVHDPAVQHFCDNHDF